jgi:hypothetical protein
LKQWKDLTEEQKQKEFPLGLQNILNNVSGRNKKTKIKIRRKEIKIRRQRRNFQIFQKISKSKKD